MAVVYALECTVTGFAYIGITAKTAKRFREHRCLCRNGKHHATKLMEDWQKYGESAFVIKVLENTDYPKRGAHCEAEQRWINHYRSIGKLYNAIERSAGLGGEITRMGVEASRLVSRVQTPEANLKRRLAQLGIPKGHGAKISATKRAKRQGMMI